MPTRHPPTPKTRTVTIIAQDPSIRSSRGKIIRSAVEVPLEDLEAGPRGGRVQIIDYDATTRRRYASMPASWVPDPDVTDRLSDDALLASPGFHAWNTYAIVMRTLRRFEYALGRRIAWGFRGHQIWVAPHAFADANAFYSEDDGALYFGYVPAGRGRPAVYTCLSHDIVAHETTHALLDGLRNRFTDPSSPEQAAFHEGFADVVALLSVLSSPDVIRTLLDASGKVWREKFVRRAALDVDHLADSPLFAIAEQLGGALEEIGARRAALRTSAHLAPSPTALRDMLAHGGEPHDLGELFVAAVLRAYIAIWHDRLIRLADTMDRVLNRERVIEEAADLAERLLHVVIRAIDYLPVVDLRFVDFVRALLTADEQVYPDDGHYELRRHVVDAFRCFGVGSESELVRWDAPRSNASVDARRSHLHLAALQSDPTECFQFLWANRRAFEIHDDSFVRVQSVRPAMRTADDGVVVRETVIEYVESVQLLARELRERDVEKPGDMPGDTPVVLYGGGAMILDEFGTVKFHVKSKVYSPKQAPRLDSLWHNGYFRDPIKTSPPRARSFAQLHLRRATSFWPTSAAAARRHSRGGK